MRWTAKNTLTPKLGDTRIVKRFFLFPARFHNTWIWLERAKVQQKRIESYSFEGGIGAVPYDEWRTIAIVNK